MALTLDLVVDRGRGPSISFSHLEAAEAAIAAASAGLDLGSTSPPMATPHHRHRSQSSQGHIVECSGSSSRGRLMLLNVSAVVASLKALAIADLTLSTVPSPSHPLHTLPTIEPEPEIPEAYPGKESSSSSFPLRLRWREYRRQAQEAGRCWGKFLSARSAAVAVQRAAGSMGVTDSETSCNGTGRGMHRGDIPPLRHVEFGLEAMTRMHQLSSLLGEARGCDHLCFFCQFLKS